VRFHDDEGVANYIDLEPCVSAREDRLEASVEGRIGQPLSRERGKSGVPTMFSSRKATRLSALLRVPKRPRVVAEPGMCRSSLHGNREASPPTRKRHWSASGKR
jgi:hypothetical protein